MKLIVGQKYISRSGNLVRAIERIEGYHVYWRDDIGPGRCTTGTFRKWAAGFADDVESPAVNIPAPKSLPEHPALDRRATNELMECYLRLQNQVDVWTRSLEQVAEYHAAVLTPSQIRAVQAAKEGSAVYSELLQQFQSDVSK